MLELFLDEPFILPPEQSGGFLLLLVLNATFPQSENDGCGLIFQSNSLVDSSEDHEYKLYLNVPL